MGFPGAIQNQQLLDLLKLKPPLQLFYNVYGSWEIQRLEGGSTSLQSSGWGQRQKVTLL